jgi:hypothetical protein
MFESLKNLLKHFTGSQTMAIVPNTTSASTASSSEDGVESYLSLGQFKLGLGTIGPANRGDIDQNILIQMYQDIASGKFNAPARGVVPEICVDGRTNRQGTRFSAPCAAGGTLSIVYGCDLGGGLPATGSATEIELTTKTIQVLKERGHSTGVHGDDHSSCGCGACAKAPAIYQHISERIEDIAALAGKLGVNVTEAEKQSIAQQAKKRFEENGFFAEDRASVVQVAQDNGARYEELVGKHNELGIALNTRSGTTIDRTRIREEYGDQYDVFVVDAWAFGNAARDVSAAGSTDEVQRIAKAITLQNLATASILGHGSLRIIPIA